MTPSAPPRQRRTSPHRDQDELRALVEALIEEARQRARRRRQKYAVVIVLVALAAVGVAGVVEHLSTGVARSELETSSAAVRSVQPRGTIALTAYATSGSPERTYLWSRNGVRDPQIEGRAFGWSPDGSRLLVRRGETLWIVRADGRGEVEVASQGSGYNAAWSPDGTQVAFEGGHDGSGAIYVVGADGMHLHRLPGRLYDGFFISGNITWAPDGRHVLFAGRASRKPSRQWLYLVRADGEGAAHPLAVDAELARPSQPAWSPDGSRIAFAITTAEYGGLYVMNADGSDVRRIAEGHGPVWSPDGSLLAFRGDGNQVVSADGMRLVTLPRGSWGGLSWSPDSRLIAYAGGESHISNGEVFVVRPDGTGRTRILRSPDKRYFLPLWRNGTASTETG